MSVAAPESIQMRGHVHPDVMQAARAVQDAGWRVSSIYRPGPGTHASGNSLDVAPMTYTKGGFGVPTAYKIWQIVKAAVPNTKWWAVAELDHVHVMRADSDRIGLNTINGTQLCETGDTNMYGSNRGLALADHPFGDVETGDAFTGDIMMRRMEGGDVALSTVGPRKLPTLGRISSLLAADAPTQGAATALKAISMQAPEALKQVQTAKAVRQMARMNTVFYEKGDGIRVITSNIGIEAKLGHSEIESLKTSIYRIPPFEPQVLQFSFGAGVWTLDLATSAPLTAILPLGTVIPYFGLLIVLAATAFNAIQGAPIQVTRKIGPGVTPMSAIWELDAGVQKAEYCGLNSALVSGHPRFLAGGSFTLAAAPDVNTQVVITGLPSNYIPTARLFQPGDDVFSTFVKSL